VVLVFGDDADGFHVLWCSGVGFHCKSVVRACQFMDGLLGGQAFVEAG
jgi:hypothetical protein